MSTTTTQTGASRHGFTLIELLVVISIIAVLASMLLPAVGMIRDMANQQKCASNQRQIAMANIAYATDNEGIPVPVFSRVIDPSNGAVDVTVPWTEYAPFTANFLEFPANVNSGTRQDVPNNFVCPNSAAHGVTLASNWSKNWVIYGMCYNSPAVEAQPAKYWSVWLGPADDATTTVLRIPIDKVVARSSKIMTMDAIAPWLCLSAWNDPASATESDTPDYLWYAAAMFQRHRNKAAASFWDGHAEAIADSKWKDDTTRKDWLDALGIKDTF